MNTKSPSKASGIGKIVQGIIRVVGKVWPVFFELGALLVTPGRWPIFGLFLTTALLGGWMDVQLSGISWWALLIPTFTNALVLLVGFGVWKETYHKVRKPQTWQMDISDLALPLMGGVVLIFGIGLSGGKGLYTLLVGGAGPMAVLAILWWPEKLARGALAEFLWRFGSAQGGSRVVKGFSAESLAEKLEKELEEIPLRNRLYDDGHQRRIRHVLQQMSAHQARKLPAELWARLLEHPDQTIRKQALRAAGRGKAENG